MTLNNKRLIKLFKYHAKGNDVIDAWLNNSYNDCNLVRQTLLEEQFETIISYHKDNTDGFQMVRMHELIGSCGNMEMIVMKQLFSRLTIRKGKVLKKHEVPILSDVNAMFSVVLHAICPNTYISDVCQKVNIALLARKSVLKKYCSEYLESVKGQWFDVKKDISGDYVRLLESNKDILTVSEQETVQTLRTLQKYYDLKKALVDIEYYDDKSWDGYRLDHKRVCTVCNLERPLSTITSSGKCTYCEHNVPCDDTDDVYMVKCITCKSMYARHVATITNGDNKCYGCINNTLTNVVTCKKCNTKYISPESYDLCANCEHGVTFEPHKIKKRVKLYQVMKLMDIVRLLGYECEALTSLYQMYNSRKLHSSVNISKYRKYDILNGDDVHKQLQSYIDQDYYEYDACHICGNETHLTDSCGRKNCNTRLCDDCAKSWYGENKKGHVINMRKMLCMFCNREPLYEIIKKYGSDNIQDIAKLPEIDNNIVYAWCIECNAIKECANRECGGELPEYTNYTCTECIESQCDISEYIKNCPECEQPTYLVSGCSHITCTICECHWCFVCNEEFDRDHIYEHMEEKHGGIYFNRAYGGDDNFYNEA